MRTSLLSCIQIVTDLCGIVYGTKYQLRCPVVSRADVRHVRFAVQQLLGAAKVAQLQYGRLRVEQQVLGFDITMADTERVDVRETPEQLVHVELHRKKTIERLAHTQATQGRGGRRDLL